MKNNKIYITKISIDHIDEKSIMYQRVEHTDEYLDFRILKKSNNDEWLIEPLNIRIQNANIYEGIIQRNDNPGFKNVKYIIQSTNKIIIYEGLNIVDKLTRGSYK